MPELKYMRRQISYLMLVLAVAFLVAVPFIRSCQYREALWPKYHAALYYAHIQAVDSDSKQPVNFDVKSNTDALSPFGKGCGPSVERILSDGSIVLTLVGKYTKEPVEFTVIAPGYQSKKVTLETMGSGYKIVPRVTPADVITLDRDKSYNSETPKSE